MPLRRIRKSVTKCFNLFWKLNETELRHALWGFILKQVLKNATDWNPKKKVMFWRQKNLWIKSCSVFSVSGSIVQFGPLRVCVHVPCLCDYFIQERVCSAASPAWMEGMLEVAQLTIHEPGGSFRPSWAATSDAFVLFNECRIAPTCSITLVPFNSSPISAEHLRFSAVSHSSGARAPARFPFSVLKSVCFLLRSAPTSSVIHINCCQTAQSAAWRSGVLLSIKTAVLSQHLLPDGTRPSVAVTHTHTHTSAGIHTYR